jgi:dTDP-4-amino-4,6-dideoxygalactose transaminase
MDPLQAALLSVKVAHYAEYTAGRRGNAADYTGRLAGLPGVRVAAVSDCVCSGTGVVGAADEVRLILPVALPHNGHIWNQYTMRVPGLGRRDALRRHLTERGIGTEIYYPVPLHAQPCFAGVVGSTPGCPVSERLAGEVLSLPIFPELTAGQRDEVIGAISEFLGVGR